MRLCLCMHSLIPGTGFPNVPLTLTVLVEGLLAIKNKLVKRSGVSFGAV